jgi:hypothetical protein
MGCLFDGESLVVFGASCREFAWFGFGVVVGFYRK